MVRKKAADAAPSATEKLPLQTSNNANVVAGKVAGKTIEEVYQKKTQLEHILLRPDTYIGSIEKHTQSLWVYEEEKVVYRPVTYVPGLYKIFDEILVNAADNKQRDPSMNSLKVNIDVDQNCISVFNNGDGVPVEIHQEEGVYVPELIFGHLLTSSNYDDNEKKTTGGRNGYGAKLTNIFSTEFIIETADGKRKKRYKQVFSNNMGKKSEPVIDKCKANENWTKVTFKPDLSKFNMTHLEDDVVALMKKRVLDMGGCLGNTVKVELNGTPVQFKSFLNYCELYLPAEHKSVYLDVNPRWKVCVSQSEGQFQQVSFVNSIATIKGGTHVDYVTNQIANHLANLINKKHKTANLKAHNVKNHLWVFVNALIDNPAFDSQTKETLTLRQTNFGSTCDLPDDFLKKIETKTGVVDSLISWVNFKQSKDLKKTDGTKKGKLTGLKKLEDANDAGGRNSEKCTLILTEGDSAKSLALAGLSVVGRDHYGVYPLRGKLLNVREASHTQVTANAEIKDIKLILGLQQGKEYDSVKSLRYGKLMLMTDQDHDGSHIKGLLINFIHTYWPSLLKLPSFLVEFITPIVKATHRDGRVLAFYTIPQYDTWRESLGGSASSWTIKYYKGLGTSTSQEAKEYFEAIDKHKKDFMWVGDQDGDAIELAFSKKKIEARKNWLRQFQPGTYLDQKDKRIAYSDFVNKELILFSVADLQRSIPSMVDGFKPGQRKIIFCAFKRNFVKEAKVAQFSGYVSEHSAYHHGEQSLAGTIIGMAQNFVGSNNINLLQPNGQFGSRSAGGKDHASARYIFTKLRPITRYLFPKDDDVLLDYLNEDGQSIEPTWYIPIIPMVLVNGSEGIGTGWSSYVPNYNPRDIIANLKRLLNDEPMEPMHPWYRGFKGTIEKTATKETGVSYTISGIVEEFDERTLTIIELPIRRWTNDYKEFLEDSMMETGAKDPFIQDYRNYSDPERVHFEVILKEGKMTVVKQEGLMKVFKLTTSISTSNMHLFDPKGVIKKYDTPEQILEEFYSIRLEFYEKRKMAILKNLELELLKLENKVRFILDVVAGNIIVSNRKRADLFLELKEKGFTPFPKKKTLEAVVAGSIDDNGEEAEEDPDEAIHKGVRASDYDYLLLLAIGTLTLEKVQQLCAERDKLKEEVEDMRRATPRALWMKDLDNLEKLLEEEDKNDAIAEQARKSKFNVKGRTGDVKAARKAPKNPPKSKKASNAEPTTEPMDISTGSAVETDVPEVAKPKGRAGATKKATVKKGKSSTVPIKVVDSDNDDDVLDLRERLANYNLSSSPESSEAIETEEVTKVQAQKKGGRKAGNDKASKPPAATRKRGPPKKQPQLVGQKLITDVLNPAENAGISPEKKVMKMRESPFNKKSGSVLGRSSMPQLDMDLSEEQQVSPDSGTGSTEGTSEAFVAPRARPQRAARAKPIVLSDSESDDPEDDDHEDDDDFSEADSD